MELLCQIMGQQVAHQSAPKTGADLLKTLLLMVVTSAWECLQRKDFVNLLSARDPQDLLDLWAKIEFLVEMVIQ